MFKKIGYIAASAAMVAIPFSTFAATNITFLTFPNSGPNATIAAGDSVDTKVTFNLTGNSELESMSLQIVDNNGNDIGMPETCFDVSDRVVAGTFTRVGTFDTTGGTEGTWGIRVRGYGVTGPGTDNNCGGTVNDNQYFSNRLTLTEDQNQGDNANHTGGGNNGNVGGDVPSNFWCTWFHMFCNGNQPPMPTATPVPTATPAPTPTTNPKCDLIAPFLGATPYAYSSMGIQLQSALLLDNPYSIPALAAGSTVRQGYFGSQTHLALANYNTMYGCH